MKSTKVAIVAVESKLVGSIVQPLEGVEHAPRTWPFTLDSSRNLSGEVRGEVVAVFVGDLDEGGSLKLMLRNPVNGALGEAYATHVRHVRYEEGR